VAERRKKLALSKTELARLLGVSPASIANWERTRGRLNLQERSMRALEAAVETGREDARARLLREARDDG
jgi:DNA-binding transcriptional regulator YiaG